MYESKGGLCCFNLKSGRFPLIDFHSFFRYLATESMGPKQFHGCILVVVTSCDIHIFAGGKYINKFQASPQLLLLWVALQRLLPKGSFELCIHRRRAAHLLITQLLGTCRETPCRRGLYNGDSPYKWLVREMMINKLGSILSYLQITPCWGEVYHYIEFNSRMVYICPDSPMGTNPISRSESTPPCLGTAIHRCNTFNQGFEYPSMNQVWITKYHGMKPPISIQFLYNW